MRLPLAGKAALRHPARIVVIAFAVVIAVGAVLLMLPVASEDPGGTPLLTALFTSTSAVCVTGLIVVDTPTYWSPFGQVVILALIQIGGFGIMSLATMLGMLVARRIGLRARVLTAVEGGLDAGEVRRVLRGVAVFSVTFEAATAVLLALRFSWGYGEPAPRAVWLGVFHAVSAFNNAGFALYSDSLIGFVSDAWIVLVITAAIIAGGIGYPVLRDLRYERRASRWSLHTKLALTTTAVLLVLGTALIVGFEWANPDTLGPMTVGDKALAGWFQGVTPRTAGFNTIDYADMRQTSWLVTDALMLIGGAPGSTAGGIKVTTFALLGFVIWSEMRGDPEVNLFDRRAPSAAQRQALSIALVGVGAVVAGTLVIMETSGLPLGESLFETVSAFGTVGLSTGVTAALPTSAHLVLVALMFLGRLGPLTLGAALVFRERERLYRFPEERPLIG